MVPRLRCRMSACGVQGRRRRVAGCVHQRWGVPLTCNNQRLRPYQLARRRIGHSPVTWQDPSRTHLPNPADSRVLSAPPTHRRTWCCRRCCCRRRRCYSRGPPSLPHAAPSAQKRRRPSPRPLPLAAAAAAPPRRRTLHPDGMQPDSRARVAANARASGGRLVDSPVGVVASSC